MSNIFVEVSTFLSNECRALAALAHGSACEQNRWFCAASFRPSPSRIHAAPRLAMLLQWAAVCSNRRSNPT